MANDFKVLDEEKLHKVERICNNLKERKLIYRSSYYNGGLIVYILKIKYGYSEIIVDSFKKNGFVVREFGDGDYCIEVSKPKPLDEVIDECFDI